MTPAERRALLGDDVIAHIHAEVDAAPAPTGEVLARLRPILSSRRPVAVERPAAAAERPAA
jgi:hypothetical protein